MDVVTSYLYGSIDTDIYMKIPEGFKLPESTNPKSQTCTQSNYKDLCMN